VVCSRSVFFMAPPWSQLGATNKNGPGDSGSTVQHWALLSAIEPRRGCDYYSAVRLGEKAF
jgi:hypothetical protein